MADSKRTWLALLALLFIYSTSLTGQGPGPGAAGPTKETPAVWAAWWVANADVKVLARERLMVVSQDGDVLDVVDGERSRLELPIRLAPLLGNAASHVRLVHNHPDSTGFSLGDLDVLRLPGVQNIVAIGHDGSAYQAGAGARYAVMPIQPVYTVARGALDEAAAQYGGMLPKHVLLEHRAHLITLVLARAGVIEYSAALGKVRHRSWSLNELLLEGVVRRAGDALDATLARIPRATID